MTDLMCIYNAECRMRVNQMEKSEMETTINTANKHRVRPQELFPGTIEERRGASAVYDNVFFENNTSAVKKSAPRKYVIFLLVVFEMK